MSGIDSMTEFYVYENMQLLEQLEEILLSGQSDTCLLYTSRCV